MRVAIEVTSVEASETYALRRIVLRDGDDGADVAWKEDARPGAFHLAARDAGGQVVAVASFSPETSPGYPKLVGWRLRGMAVARDHQGRGFGAAILNEAATRLAEEGVEMLWCNARDTALGFYECHGFVVDGDGFNTDETGLPHHRMCKSLGVLPAS